MHGTILLADCCLPTFKLACLVKYPAHGARDGFFCRAIMVISLHRERGFARFSIFFFFRIINLKLTRKNFLEYKLVDSSLTPNNYLGTSSFELDLWRYRYVV